MNLPGEGWSQLRQPEGGLALRQALLSIGQNAPRRLALLAEDVAIPPNAVHLERLCKWDFTSFIHRARIGGKK